MSRYRIENVPGNPSKGWHYGNADEAGKALREVFGTFNGSGLGTGSVKEEKPKPKPKVLSNLESGKYGSYLFGLGSLLAGYPANVGGKKVDPLGNVFGMATYSVDKYGNKKKMNPTDNLTGYPVITSDPDIIKSIKKKNPYVFMKSDGTNTTIYPSGNITGWPTIWTATDMQGNTSNIFSIPGYASPGSIAYDDEGFPGFSSSEVSAGNPPSLIEIQSTNNTKSKSKTSNFEINDYNESNKRRKRSLFTSLLKEDYL